MRRREFLLHNAILASAAQAQSGRWNPGSVVHVLPTVNHQRILLKASFREPVRSPALRLGRKFISGVQTSTGGHFASFDAIGLEPATVYELQLLDGTKELCAPWTLRTFPAPDDRPAAFRLLIYTCAGGHPVLKLPDGELRFLSLDRRRRMLARALSFRPDAVIANGDHVYWDLRTSGAKSQGESPEGAAFAGHFRRNLPVFGTPNEMVLQKAAGPQIAQLYGASFRQTPVFFITDDHDHFDNDEAGDRLVSFPPDPFMMRLVRATRRLYYPEFLPDANRPAGLAGASEADTPAATGEAFGTLRYGRLAELLLYDCRRYLTLTGPSATVVPPETEDWIVSRLADAKIDHIVQVPSLPIGWSAGKWGDWYPDFLDDNGKLGVRKTKPYWQSGWADQHDRLLRAASASPGHIPLFLCGDLHAIGETHIHRTGKIDVSANPVISVLTGPVGTGRTGWPSVGRGTKPLAPKHLEADEKLPAEERNGFLIADFTPATIKLQFFHWTVDQPDAALDSLEPFRVTELSRVLV